MILPFGRTAVRPYTLLFALCSLLGSCGYIVGRLHEVKSVEVPVFDNVTLRRLNEQDLTGVVVREIQSQGIRVGGAETDYLLKGSITEFEQPSVIEGLQDQVVVGSVAIRVDIELKNRRTGVVVKDSRVERATVVGSRGENIDSARFEVFQKLAQWIVTRMEVPWEDR